MRQRRARGHGGSKSTPGRTARSAAAESQDERRFLARYDAGAFERPSVTVDVVLITVKEGGLATLLLRRVAPPFKGRWALPGGFVRMTEGLETAAARVLADKCGLKGVWLEQLYTFGDPKRDPRTRVISVTYAALVDAARLAASATIDALQVARLRVPWEGETGGPVDVTDANGQDLPLAFDHALMIGMAVKRLRGKLDYAPIGFQLLPEQFTLFELQGVHEAVLGRELNKDSFRRRMLASGLLEATGEQESDVGHRPAERYRFRSRSAV
jgi:8-oxo-dGTP diphosphatase